MGKGISTLAGGSSRWPCDGRAYVRSFQHEERLLTAAKHKEEDKFMNEQTKSESKLDELTKASEPLSTKLTAEELEQVSGGKEASPPIGPCCA